MPRWLWRFAPAWADYISVGAPLRPGPTGLLSLAVAGRWNPESVFVQLNTKIDEAGTHDDSDYMTMAGYSRRLWQWNRFDGRWKKALRKAGLDYFHVKEHGDHPFALKGPFIADKHLMFGFMVRLDKVDYYAAYRNGGWGGKAQPDSMYGLCFRYCLSLVLQIAVQECPLDGLELNFLLESGHPNSGGPTEIVRQLKKKNISGVSEYLGVAVPGDKKRHPGLQAADGLASGLWHLESHGTPQLLPPQKPGLDRWRSEKRPMKVPVFRCHLDQDELSKFKEGYFKHLEFRRNFWHQKRLNPPLDLSASSEGQSS
jgi:uncharacterized protein DUF3800